MEFGAIFFLTITILALGFAAWQITKTNRYLRNAEKQNEKIQQMLKSQSKQNQNEVEVTPEEGK